METRDVTFCNLTEDQIYAIKILLGSDNDCEPKDEILPFPQPGDRYYFVYSDGEIGNQSYYPDIVVHRDRLSAGNVFRTKEELEFELERIKVLREMKQFEEPKDYEWLGCSYRHYYICWDFHDDRIRINSASISKSGDIYFKSKEDAEACIKFVGEHRIKKFYLRIY